MRLDGTALAFLVIASLLQSQAATASPPDWEDYRAPDQRFEDALVTAYLLPVLGAAGKVGRIYYSGTCPPGDYNHHVQFPTISVEPPLKGETGIGAIRQMFRNENSVKVTEPRPGIISIAIGDVSDQILQTQISSLYLNNDSQYNDILALIALEGSREVRDTMHKLGIAGSDGSFEVLLEPREDSMPHLPALIENVTMDEVLDLIAKTFKTVVVYGFCTHPSLYHISLTGNISFGIGAANAPK